MCAGQQFRSNDEPGVCPLAGCLEMALDLPIKQEGGKGMGGVEWSGNISYKALLDRRGRIFMKCINHDAPTIKLLSNGKIISVKAMHYGKCLYKL